jgi:hypothetical protein
MTDKRSPSRQQVRCNGLILDAVGKMISPCILVNIFASGAKLKLPTPLKLPEEFVLSLAQSGGVQRRCQVAWRSNNDVGVEFVRLKPGEVEIGRATPLRLFSPSKHDRS